MPGILPSRPIQDKFYRALIGEFIGTYFLVFTIVMAICMFPTLAPLVIGFQLMTQVFAYGYICGAMYNPAVTTAVHLVKWNRGEDNTGKIFWDWLRFVVVQLLGGVLGASIAYAIVGTDIAKTSFPSPAPVSDSGKDIARAFFGETFFTFTLASVVLNCAVSKAYAKDGNHFYGLCIGMSVFSGASCMGSISGAAFNPAVSTALQIVKSIARTDGDTPSPLRWFWLYWLSAMLGAYLATLVFTSISCEDIDLEEEPAKVNESSSLLPNKTASDTVA